VPDPLVRKHGFSIRFFLGFQDGEEMRLVESVESFDQMVGLDYLVLRLFFFRDANEILERKLHK
jgi:hypothetical protein